MNVSKARAKALHLVQLPLADGTYSKKQWPKPKYTYAYDKPKLLYPKMPEYNMQEQLVDDILNGRECDWIMACCSQWCEHEFIHELAQVDMTAFYVYRHYRQICRSLATGLPTGRTIVRERPLLTGIAFIKNDYAYDERRLRSAGRFYSLPKYDRGNIIGTLKNGKPKFELIKRPITITTVEAHRMLVNGLLSHGDNAEITFTPKLGMRVAFKPSCINLSPLLLQAARNAEIYVVSYDESSGMCDLMIGNIATTASAADLVLR